MASDNNKRIAKNTIFLYFRMAIIMLVSIYTSRVVLATLGIEDFGIYNVVGGVVSMLGFLNGAMSSATSRYITFEMGRGNTGKLAHVFRVSVNVHAMLAVLIVVLAETIGLWYFHHKLVLSPERVRAAMWVYQCSIVSTVVAIMSVPYNATIIAHEKMSAFAYISIIEVVLKLLVVFALYVIPFDHLIIYALLLVAVQLVVRSCYTIYCNKHFEEAHYRLDWDGKLTKEMMSFAVFSLWGNLAVVLYTQGLNLMLNAFFGPVVNAARAVAVQVQHAVQQFISNFQTALNPQITKSYAAGDYGFMFNLMYRSARFSFFLMLILALPILLETDFILNLWLKEVPAHTVTFLRLILLTSLTYTMSNPLIVLAQATGKVKKYQMIAGGVLLLILPISYVCLRLGMPAWSVFLVHFCIETFDLFVRMYLLRSMANLSMRAYCKNVCLPAISVSALSAVVPLLLRLVVPDTWWAFAVVCLVSIASTFCVVSYIGLTAHERQFVFSKVNTVLRKFHPVKERNI